MFPEATLRPTPVVFGRVTPILRVNDLAASLDYYVRVLGFRTNWTDGDPLSFASVSRDDCHLFLTVGDQGHTGSWLWVAVSDADTLHEELSAKAARVRRPPVNYPWGSRELHVEDLDGNVLRFGSDNKPGEPIGEWLDMHGVRWRSKPEGGWTRVE
jgi:catechol 2,3-dioxygenase-like lactoylglutathione lyase family enzyme